MHGYSRGVVSYLPIAAQKRGESERPEMSTRLIRYPDLVTKGSSIAA
jgi:hypothetical protein